jgi:ATP-dependent Clp protease ATP-binding subunit ClpA
MDPLDITDKDRLLDMLAARRQGNARLIDEAEMAATIKKRVRGQDPIVDDVSRFIRLQWGKERRGKPIASLLFVGPPATGKTELAKAMAEYLFEDEKHMLRFDCSEFSGAEGKTRLIGTPGGYVDSDKGGQLTRPMLSNPRRLVLFDEIEKAYVGIFDLLLSMMGEGRLTEQGSGKVADFTQAMIVLTSNAEHETIGKLTEQFDDQFELGNAVRSVIRDAKTFRPEIISRFDQIYVFKPLEGIVNAEIAALKIAKAAEEYGVEIEHIDAEIVFQIMELGDTAKDTRELTRHVDAKLGELLLAAREQGLQRVRIGLDDAGRPKLNTSD